MPTPVGPVEPDPDDPDLWPEWYQDDDDLPPPRGFPMWMRVAAVVALVGFVVMFVLR